MHGKQKHWIKSWQVWILAIAALVAATAMGLKLYTPKAAIPLIESYAKGQGIDLKIEKIHSWLPLRCSISKLTYVKKGLGSIEMDNIKVQFSMLPLLKRSFRIEHFNAQKALVQIDEQTAFSATSVPIEWPGSFFGIHIDSAKVDQLTLLKPKMRPWTFAIEAEGSISKGGDKLELKAKIHEKEPFEEELNVQLKASKKTKIAQVKVNFCENKGGWLKEQIKSHLPLKSVCLDISASGHISHWISVIKGSPKKSLALLPPIRGHISGTLSADITAKSPLELELIAKETGVKAAFSISARHVLDIKGLEISGPSLGLTGEGKVNLKERSIRNAHAKITLKNGAHLPFLKQVEFFEPFQLTADLKGPLDALQLELKSYKQNMTFESVRLNNLTFALSSNIADAKAIGLLDGFFFVENRRFNVGFGYKLNKEVFDLKNLKLSTAGGSLDAKGAIGLADETPSKLTFSFNTQNFPFYQRLFLPGLTALNAENIQMRGTYTDSLRTRHRIEATGALVHVDIDSVFVERAEVGLDFDHIFHAPEGSAKLNLNKIYASGIEVQSVHSEIAFHQNKGTFKARFEHAPKDHMFVDLSGHWSYANKHFGLYINELSGQVRDVEFLMGCPTEVNLSQSTLNLEPTLIKFGKGFLTASINTGDTIGLSLKMQEIPADLISMISPNFKAKGALSGDLTVQKTQTNLNAHGHFQMQNGSLEYSQWPLFENKEALFNLQLSNSKLQVSTSVQHGGAEDIYFALMLPVEIDTKEFLLRPLRDAPFSSQLQLNTEVAEFSTYLASSGHAVSGYVSGSLMINGTLDSPKVKGHIDLLEGQYESYETGLQLKGIQAFIKADKDRIVLENLEASDSKKGTLSAKGSMKASFKELFPFEIQAALDETLIVNLDGTQAKSTGILTLSGNLNEALLKGKLNISSANIDIPDKIRKEPPSLNIQFKAAPKKKHRPTKKDEATLKFDVQLDAPSTITVQGRGLKSICAGSVHASGTHKDLQLFGKLSVTSGSFKFAKINFNLTEGTITFAGPLSKTLISLVAEQAVSDLNVYIALRGSMLSPRLTLSSVPEVPLSNLLSKILFNKDISEIDPFQAIQLAQTALELSSGEVSVMDRIQNSLGLDVFSFTSSGSTQSVDKEGDKLESQEDLSEDESVPVAVQVGKYITRGILLTMTQGTTAESAKYNIDIDLQYGLLLQLETMQNREGKISLKWNKAY